LIFKISEMILPKLIVPEGVVHFFATHEPGAVVSTQIPTELLAFEVSAAQVNVLLPVNSLPHDSVFSEPNAAAPSLQVILVPQLLIGVSRYPEPLSLHCL
jgi:hypothetical protein